jgi:hypothetical protein
MYRLDDIKSTINSERQKIIAEFDAGDHGFKGNLQQAEEVIKEAEDSIKKAVLLADNVKMALRGGR